MSEAITALLALRRHGFRGHRILQRGRIVSLHYRRSANATTSDVVLVYGEDDAEAYRAPTGSLPDDGPFECATQPDLLREVVGTVVEVVEAVMAWPPPGQGD